MSQTQGGNAFPPLLPWEGDAHVTRRKAIIFAGLMAGTCFAAPAHAQGQPPQVRDSFPIGNGEGIQCQVQDRSVGNPAKRTMFDRRWAVVCRDSSRPVATIYAFRSTGSSLPEVTEEDIECPTSIGFISIGQGIRRDSCKLSGANDLDWFRYQADSGDMAFVAEGFAAYDAATQLALRSVVDNAIADGPINVATTSIADPLSFARVQAESLAPEQALWEGYRRNLGGEYAEAAAYFETLQQRLAGNSDETINPGEFLVNRALQKSNLGQFAEANQLFSDAEPLTEGDPIAGRLHRNFEAIHLLNQGFVIEAIDRASRDLTLTSAGAEELESGLRITLPLSARINQSGEAGGILSFVDELKLTPQERAEIIDAQALQLRGTGLRIEGDSAGARRSLLDAYSRAMAVRDGRVTSITRMRAQILGELSLIAEQDGRMADAEALLRNALELLEVQYPERRALSGAQARLGSFLLRRGRDDEATALYRTVIDRSLGKRDAVLGFANQLNPYYRRLATKVDGDPAAAAEYFRALQVLQRPGVAETQAVLARELSAKSDEGAALFRQSLDLGRDIERLRMRYAALGKADATAQVVQERAELSTQIEDLERQQQATQVRLNDFPQYRVVAARSLELSEFKAQLAPGEAYTRLAIIGGDIFMFYTDRDTSRAYRVAMSEEDLDFHVDMLRASISLYEGGQYSTYPYDVGMARELYKGLFGPLEAELSGVTHLVFEPDGAMLRLPIDILVTDDASVARYNSRVASAGGDAFDFTGTSWFGRDRLISTTVSAQAFVDARATGGSAATQDYLGMGRNAPIGDGSMIRAASVGGSDSCGWDVELWNRPISDSELLAAEQIVGESESRLVTGPAFSDVAISQADDLDQYRVVHFATHGLVTPPRPGCPANPALVTSFGAGESDGLLTFEEIFDLDLDADIVILSACDTAGAASIEATRAAGLTSGGGTSLDGLVRAFVGAGSRSVMASHWPAPDDFQATGRLMTGMFSRARQGSVGAALRQSQRLLMDDPDTSHPYYWGGFSIVGDASMPLLSAGNRAAPIAALDDASSAAVVGQ